MSGHNVDDSLELKTLSLDLQRREGEADGYRALPVPQRDHRVAGPALFKGRQDLCSRIPAQVIRFPEITLLAFPFGPPFQEFPFHDWTVGQGAFPRSTGTQEALHPKPFEFPLALKIF